MSQALSIMELTHEVNELTAAMILTNQRLIALEAQSRKDMKMINDLATAILDRDRLLKEVLNSLVEPKQQGGKVDGTE